MPKPTRYIKTLQEIIDLCDRFIEHIKDKTDMGKDLLIDFEEEGVLEVISDYLD